MERFLTYSKIHLELEPEEQKQEPETGTPTGYATPPTILGGDDLRNSHSHARFIELHQKELKDYIDQLKNINKNKHEELNELCKNHSEQCAIQSNKMKEFEKSIKENLDKAVRLYIELNSIATKFNLGQDVTNDIKSFFRSYNSTQLESSNKIALKLEPEKTRENHTTLPLRTAAKNGFIKSVADLTIGDIYGKYLYNIAKSNFGPDTAGMLDLAHEKRNDLNYTKDAIELKNWNDPRVAQDKDYIRTKVIEQYSRYDFDEDLIHGYFFKNHSEPSMRIANDTAFLNVIKEKKDVILDNNVEISIGFPNYGHNTKSNLYLAFGNIDIRNRYIDKNGDLHLKVYDTYDFNPKEDNPLVQSGRDKMFKGELKPFFTIHDIIIPKKVLDELWK